jgi:hypothetical protein
MPATVQGPKGQVTNPNIPSAWFTVDIKVGSLTVRLDEDSWMKANIDKESYLESIFSIEKLINQQADH